MEFTEEQKEYFELYANTVGLKNFLDGTNLNSYDRVEYRKKLFLEGFEKYKQIPEEIRNIFSKNSELEEFAKELRK